MNGRFLRNVLLKAALLLVIFNFACAALYPLDGLGRISGYNLLFTGRERFPFGENPQETYSFSLYNVEAMFQSLTLDGAPKSADEFRVLVIGDSATWGTLQRPQETLAGQLNARQLTTCDGKHLRFYNLGYPTLSLTKDLMIMQTAMRYQPDLILWPVTLQSFPLSRQVESPLARNNPLRIQALNSAYALHLDLSELAPADFWQRTLIGQRRNLADLIRLQLYGPLWSATGIDQLYPSDYSAAARDLEDDAAFNGWSGPEFPPDGLAWQALAAGWKIAGDTPILLANEPVLISSGANSEVRYNFYYPRWAYDAYRAELAGQAQANGWQYVDAWNAVPESEFTNSAIHMTASGTALFVDQIVAALPGSICLAGQ
jgi:hypothetical protein